MKPGKDMGDPSEHIVNWINLVSRKLQLSSSLVLHSAKCKPSKTENRSVVPRGHQWGDGPMNR